MQREPSDTNIQNLIDFDKNELLKKLILSSLPRFFSTFNEL